ncbi:MAG: hypothetical protein CMK74_20220 [Pseudomonadales bacterium]|nr:hypothetical protein [Pseudomonadales bacterium]
MSIDSIIDQLAEAFAGELSGDAIAVIEDNIRDLDRIECLFGSIHTLLAHAKLREVKEARRQELELELELELEREE